MLRITPSTSAGRAKSYYSTADYYTEGQELTGYWRGKGAAMLGLNGAVDRDRWDELCDNLVPRADAPLTIRQKSDRRVGYDFNFHVPKSVSLLYGLTRDERILDAFRDSVRATMEDIEAEAKTRVRTGGRNEDRTTGNLVWGEFIHFSARPEEGIPDPHLHAHCFVFNATFDTAEDRWKAGQFGDLKRDGPYFEAVFHARLARRLEELGLATQRTKKGWDLAGLDSVTLDKFSRRTARIEKLAREKGITDPERKAELGARTRSSKIVDATMQQLEVAWRLRLTDAEARSLDALSSRIGREAIPQDDSAARAAVERAMEHSFERSSVLPERTLLTAALKQAVGKSSRESIEELTQAQDLIHADRNGRRLVTTKAVLEEESRILAFARAGRGACRPIAPNVARFNRPKLNDEQRHAIRHILSSRDRVMIVRGAAGAGKTWAMQEVREAAESAGVKVCAFAPSSGASRDVLRGDGFAAADTIASLLTNPELQQEAQGALILIDEAGQVGTKTLRELFDLAEKQNARVLLVGGERQHGPVERGSALRLLETQAGIKPAEITEIQRQREVVQYKAAIESLSKERTAEGFQRLDDLGWIREVGDEDRDAALASAYIDSISSGATTLAVSPTHAEGDRITAEIRRQMRLRGLLGDESHTISQLLPANLTLGQKHDPTSYSPGDVLVFHQNAVGHRKGSRVAVGTDPLPLNLAERFTVYHRSQLDLAKGDRLRITKNASTLDNERRLNNGDLYTITGFTPEGDLRLDGKWTLSRDYGHLTHGLVVTSFASQGKTVDHVLIGQSSQSFAASSREQFYVSASRGRYQALVFTDDKEELLKAVSHGDERLSGTELVADARVAHRHLIREEQTRRAHERKPELTVTLDRERVDYDR